MCACNGLGIWFDADGRGDVRCKTLQQESVTALYIQHVTHVVALRCAENPLVVRGVVIPVVAHITNLL